MSQQPPNSLDAYKPAEMAKQVDEIGVGKAGLSFQPLLIRAVLAGAFIAFGCLFFLIVVAGSEEVTGPLRFAGGLAFSLGLVLVVIGGAELFTGNALMVMALVSRKITLLALLRNWFWALLGNLLGALVIVAFAVMAGLADGPLIEAASRIAKAKVELSPLQAFARGILCNALVCLAVWLTISARTAAGKFLVILLPIAGFVALGFEHCVANFFLLPFAALVTPEVGAAAILGNLVPVILGNIVGGGGGVALSYHLAYPELRAQGG